jgi:phospholipase C
MVFIEDASYRGAKRSINLKSSTASVPLDLAGTSGWHDFRVTVEGFPKFEQRFAGRIENGKESISDPAMSGV